MLPLLYTILHIYIIYYVRYKFRLWVKGSSKVSKKQIAIFSLLQFNFKRVANYIISIKNIDKHSSLLHFDILRDTQCPTTPLLLSSTL